MGSGPSKSEAGPAMRRIPSAAFGRLRIDSPSATPGSGRGPAASLAQRRKQRGVYESVPLLPGEASPLLTGAASNGHPRMLLSASVSGGTGGGAGGGSSPGDLSTLSGGPPPLAVWIGPALCCAMAYALYNIFIKKGSATINPVLGGVILQLVAAMLGLFLLLLLVYWEGGTEDVLVYDGAGIRWAVLAGVAVGSAEIISFFVSSLGVQAMQSIPIIIGGSVMFGTTIGAVFLREELTYRGWAGVVMISCGISLVGLDTVGGE
jgi:transporter family protein